MELITKSLDTPLEVHKFDGDEGQLTAYVTTFGNTDKEGDIIAPGALDKFIANFKNTPGSTLPMLWQHNQTEVIGEWTDFTINSRGVKGTGEIFTDVTRGNDVRNLIKRGAVGSVSIGFRSKDYEVRNNGEGFLFKEIELIETSVVLNPANPRAKITSAKTEDGQIDLRKLEKALREAGLSRKESMTLISKGKEGLREVVDQDQKNKMFINNLSQLLENI